MYGSLLVEKLWLIGAVKPPCCEVKLTQLRIVPFGKPRAVIDALVATMEGGYANVHRGLHTLSNEATEAFEKAREIVRLVKDTKLKVQAAIQEDHVRVSGKNRDDLQKVIALLKDKDFGIAIQFTNYRSA